MRGGAQVGLSKTGGTLLLGSEGSPTTWGSIIWGQMTDKGNGMGKDMESTRALQPIFQSLRPHEPLLLNI